MPPIDPKLLLKLLSNPQLNPQLLESILGNLKEQGIDTSKFGATAGQGLDSGVDAAASFGSKASGALGDYGALAGSAISMIDGMDGEASMLGDVSSNALNWGAAGAKVAGPYGALIAGAAGGIYGGVMHKKQEDIDLKADIKAEKLFDTQALTASKQNSKTVLSSYPSQGVESAGYFQAGKGGNVPQFNHGGEHESHADKARRFRTMRPVQGEYYEGQEENTHSTHLVKTYEADGKYYAAPSITNKKAPYANYQPQSFSEAMNAGEGIPFDTQKEASEFAEGDWKLPKYPRPAYNVGGKIPNSNIEYQAEGGEVIEHNPFSLPGTDQHGEVNPIASNISKIQGDKHSAPSGGVGMEGGERIFSDQLYVDDSIYQSLKNI
jgi:hypothetical protein